MPDVTLNFSKSGTSVSVGPKGFTTNYSRPGTRTTYSLPGTGLSYRGKTHKWSGDAPNRRVKKTPPQPPPLPAHEPAPETVDTLCPGWRCNAYKTGFFTVRWHYAIKNEIPGIETSLEGLGFVTQEDAVNALKAQLALADAEK